MEKFKFHDLENVWYYFLTLEEDLNNTSKYVEPDEQERTCLFEFYKIILLSCCEIETVFKMIHKKLKGSSGRDISDYKGAILERFPNIGNALVIVPRWREKNLHPFEDWNTGKLEWWDIYQKGKHNRTDKYEIVTCSMAVNSVAALYILILCLYEMCGFECKADDSRYFESDYYHHPIYENDYPRLLDAIS